MRDCLGDVEEAKNSVQTTHEETAKIDHLVKTSVKTFNELGEVNQETNFHLSKIKTIGDTFNFVG